jgi:DNA-binding XRE family transcriptional regulator
MTQGLDAVAARLRRLRRDRGLTQAQLATRAGVSRQLVSAVEAGRHLPRVDAGVALARAVSVSAEELLQPDATEIAGVVYPPPAEGAPVRLGRVGERLVCAHPPVSGESWAPADGVVSADGVRLFPQTQPGAVVVGCDPAIGLAECLVARRGGPSLLAVSASTAAALDALARGRAHAAVVHGPEDALPTPPVSVRRLSLAHWRVGLTAPAELGGGWWRDALSGRWPVVQREPGAVAQDALLRAVAETGGRPPAGPVVDGHIEAASRARREGQVAVSIEPVALARDMAFHPLECHTAQLWVSAAWVEEPCVVALQEQLTSAGFHRQLAALGGYDLVDCGTAA